ncbi:hypothetical protein Dsin_018509 [Dipteronia sinensis]|uniref:RNase H type-1 domain-containing protein n=1 Tax=Dipteronia sinensis TaxID=43782 RepID=A0AAE0E1Z9_9ROSI|nr:hypothetical protein Dsin_018509 [Dipteronia sinensis]
MAWNAGCSDIIVESDALSTVQIIAKVNNYSHPLFSLIQSCKKLINSEWNCCVNHVFREANKLADGLAHLGKNIEPGILFFEEPPPAVYSVFDGDFRGLTCLRSSPVLFSC